MISAIIVAAGSSRRMGFDKIFASLAGQPVLWYSLRAFCACPEIDEVFVIAKADRVAEVQAMAEDPAFRNKVRRVLPGGAERHLSVWQGLKSVESHGSELVAIHDGARPLTTPALISEVIRIAQLEGAACVASPIPDTVKRASTELVVTDSVERTGLWAMQTPQVFASGLILQAYAALVAKHEMVTDEVSAVQKLGKRIALLKNDDWNFKITVPQDLELAEQVLALRAKKAQAGT